MKRFKLTALLAFGLMCLTLALALTGYAFGLMPDAFRTELDARAKVAEALAVQLAATINAGESELTTETLEAVVERNGDVFSVAVRDAKGEVLAVGGDHARHWTVPAGSRSTPTHVRVPLLGANGQQGSIEIAFGPASHASRLFGVPVSLFAFLGWLGAAGFIGYGFLLRRSLKELDPGRVIPTRVQKAFDTLSEGVVIVDQRERIRLANSAFAAMAGDERAVRGGAALNGLGWRMGDKAASGRTWPWHAAIKSGEDQRDVALMLRGADGTVHELNVNAARIVDERDRLLGAIVTMASASGEADARQALALAKRQLAVARAEQEEAERALVHLRDHDRATNCLLRDVFLAHVDEVREKGGHSLVLLRLAAPGSLAQTFGASFVEDVATVAGRSLLESAGPQDRVGRIGSDVFAFCGPDAARRLQHLSAGVVRAVEDVRAGLSAGMRTTGVRLERSAPGAKGAACLVDDALCAMDSGGAALGPLASPAPAAAAESADVDPAAARARQMVEARLGAGRGGLLLYLSVRGWSELRDSLGDEAARDVLNEVAARIRETSLRDASTALLFGEGTCVAAFADPAGTLDEDSAAWSALGTLREPVRAGSRLVHASAMAGLARVEPEDDNPALALRHARLAMRAARREGASDGWRRFETSMVNEATQRLDIEAGIRSALRANAFQLVFQPIVELSTGKLRAAETLLRCTAPELEGVRIDRIIAVAERSSLITRIDAWVVEAALTQMEAWDREGIVLPKLSVNLSARQCTDSVFVDTIAERLRRASFAPKRLQIEVTESAALSDIAQAAPQIERLQRMGVHIAVDDFGTGQASLSYVQRLHPDVIKIDRSFVADLHTNHANATLVTATTAMAQALGIKVVAEGVETSEELEFLREIGCDEVQGYLIAKPMPVEAASQWMHLFSEAADARREAAAKGLSEPAAAAAA